MFILKTFCVNYYNITNQPYSVILLWTSECEISFSSYGSSLFNDSCYSKIYTMKQICTNNAIDFTFFKAASRTFAVFPHGRYDSIAFLYGYNVSQNPCLSGLKCVSSEVITKTLFQTCVGGLLENKFQQS